MGNPAITCPHGIKPKAACIECKRDYVRQTQARRRAGIPPIVPTPTPCEPHGVPRGYCKDCKAERQRARRQADPEVRRRSNESNRRWRAANPGADAKRSREARAANPEAHRERERRWAEANQDRRKAQALARRQANPEREREHSFLSNIKTRMRKVGTPIKPETFDPTLTLSTLIKRDGGKCHWCGEPCRTERDRESLKHPDAATCDHWQPLSKNGYHLSANVWLAHRGCNLEKSDDVCLDCGGPITELGEQRCAECRVQRKWGRERLAVCGQCGYVEVPGSWCSGCRAKNSYVARDLTRRDANALSRSLFPDHDDWLVWAA